MPVVIHDDKDKRKSIQAFLNARCKNPTEKSLRVNLGRDVWLLMLKAYAEGNTLQAISDMIKRDYDFKSSTTAILKMTRAKMAQVYIKSFRDEYMAKVMDVPIANKRIRIDDHQKNLDILNEDIAKLRGKKKKTAKEKMELIRLVALSTSLKAEVREEMEKRPQLFQNVNVSMSGMSDEQLHRRKQELIGSVRRAEGRGTFGTAPDTDDIGAEAEVESA